MAKKQKFDYDLIVIGSGAGGSAAANIAAKLGKKVALIEAGLLGGTSSNYGDVPLRSMLNVAHTYTKAKMASRFGLRTATIGYNYLSLRNWQALAVKRTGTSRNRHYYEKSGISVFNSRAHFISPHEVSVSRRRLFGKNFLIATGANWQVPKIPGIKTVPFLTPNDFVRLKRPPKSIFIIGGGSISAEVASLLSSFGSKTYISDSAKQILPDEDSDVSQMVESNLKKYGNVESLTSTKILSVQKEGGSGARVTFLRGGVEKSIKVEAIMLAGKPLANVDIGLENAGVEYKKNGILVDDYLRTNVRHIFAAGDCLGENMNSQTALLESRIVANNIFTRKKISPSYKANVRSTFTNPPCATVGLTEQECTKNKIRTKTAIVPLNMVARSNVDDFRDGFVKIIADKSGLILGGAVVCPEADSLIHELALAIQNDLTVANLAETPHAFLSWSEAIRLAAAKLL